MTPAGYQTIYIQATKQPCNQPESQPALMQTVNQKTLSDSFVQAIHEASFRAIYIASKATERAIINTN